MLELLQGRPDLALRDNDFEENAYERALRFDRSDIARLIELAGYENISPIEDDDSPIYISKDKALTIAIEVTSVEPKGSRNDAQMAKVIAEQNPALSKFLGWRASAAHWRMLKACERPLPLVRISYFARGFGNTPIGQELADGPRELGETYYDAVTRFCDESLLTPIAPAEVLDKILTRDKVRQLLREAGVVAKGNKVDVLTSLIKAIGVEPFEIKSAKISISS